MEEIWKEIPSYEGVFEISNFGRIKSLSRTVIRSDGKPMTTKEKILKQGKNGKGYPCVRLSVMKVKTNLVTHRYVAKLFIPNPENKREVNHIDGVKTNNHYTNLEWNTPSENTLNAFKLGLKSHLGEKQPHSKLKTNDVIEIKHLLKTKFYTAKEIAKMYGVCFQAIYLIKYGYNWSHVTI